MTAEDRAMLALLRWILDHPDGIVPPRAWLSPPELFNLHECGTDACGAGWMTIAPRASVDEPWRYRLTDAGIARLAELEAQDAAERAPVPRYASGEVPEVGDCVRASDGDKGPVVRIEGERIVYAVGHGAYGQPAPHLTLVFRASKPAEAMDTNDGPGWALINADHCRLDASGRATCLVQQGGGADWRGNEAYRDAIPLSAERCSTCEDLYLRRAPAPAEPHCPRCLAPESAQSGGSACRRPAPPPAPAATATEPPPKCPRCGALTRVAVLCGGCREYDALLPSERIAADGMYESNVAWLAAQETKTQFARARSGLGRFSTPWNPLEA